MLLDKYHEEFAILAFAIVLIGDQLEQSKLKEVYLNELKYIPSEEVDAVLLQAKTNREEFGKKLDALRTAWSDYKKQRLFDFSEEIIVKSTEEIPYSTRTSLMYYCLSKMREHW